MRFASTAGRMPNDIGRTTTDFTGRRDWTTTLTGSAMSQQANPASSVWSNGR